MDAKSAYEGLGRILAASSSQEPSNKSPKVISTDTKDASENGVASQPEEKQAENPNAKEEDNSPIPLQTPEITPESWEIFHKFVFCCKNYMLIHT